MKCVYRLVMKKKVKQFSLWVSFFFFFSFKLLGANFSDLYLKRGSDELQLLKMLLGPEGVHVVKQLAQKPKRILFLGARENTCELDPTLADRYAAAFEQDGVEIYKTDLLFEDKPPVGNLFERRVDHKEAFGFSDNYFDVIIGVRILCPCNEKRVQTMCGGFNVSNSDELGFFLKEVVRVLNKENPLAFAFLHGCDQKYSSMATFQANQIMRGINETLATKFAAPIKYIRTVYINEKEEAGEAESVIFTRYGIVLGNAFF